MSEPAHRGRASTRSPDPRLDEREQAIRAAWLYYFGDMTQAQVAKRLGLNRVRVNRLLAEARAAGIVQIQINAKTAPCIALEEALTQRYGLQEAIVVPGQPDEDGIRAAIGAAAGAALSTRLREGMSIGMGWGQTLRTSLRAIPLQEARSISIVSLLGGLTRGSAMNAYETASRLADLVGAECFYIAGPAFADTPEMRDLLLQQSILQDAFEHARRVDLAFLSAGSLHPTSTMSKLGLVGREDMASLKAAGAVGDLCAHWIDGSGNLVDHPLNRRVIALEPAALRDIPCVVLASGGPHKVPVVRGALIGGYVDVVVTDEETARQVLAASDERVARAAVHSPALP